MKPLIATLMLFCTGTAMAAPEPWRDTQLSQWTMLLAGLLLLALVLLIVLRRIAGGRMVSGVDLRPVASFSLGLKEKLVLMQVGPARQILLGVTPGRIETLLVLEGDACLEVSVSAPSFAMTLQDLLMRGRQHEPS
ncbi:MAG: flagellar biosynthetic protein FliO [Methylococcales bacterium]|nr:flagellar biosynthetic protein FliO [Methylococcales bacterium]